jgi:hypothetical protein
MAMIGLMSRTQPSIRAPAAPRTWEAVDNSSPQGATRCGFEQANTGMSPGCRLSIRAISSSYGLTPSATW